MAPLDNPTAANSGKVKPLSVKYTRPWLYEKQKVAMFYPLDFRNRPARYSFIEATTKAGKTVSAIAWLLEIAITTGALGRNYWWIAPVYNQTKIAFRRTVRAFKRTPWFVAHVDNQELSITLLNGAMLWFKSGEKPDNLYGEDVHAAVIDEASRVREEAWWAVRSTVTATRGPIRCIGNVKGRKNWFFRAARRAESGAPRMGYYKLTAYDAVEAGVLARKEIEDAKAILPESVFNELYLAIPSDDESNPFGLSHIRACISPDGYSEKKMAAAGMDIARKANWSVIIGLDRKGHMTGMERFRESWKRQRERAISRTRGVPLLVDATGVGDIFYEGLREDHPDASPYVFTNKSKQALMEGLAIAFQNRTVTIIDEKAGPEGKVLIDELENFEFQVSPSGNVIYAAPEGMDDDSVMSLALAVEQLRRTMPTAGLGGGNDDLTRISPWTGEGPDGEATDSY